MEKPGKWEKWCGEHRDRASAELPGPALSFKSYLSILVGSVPLGSVSALIRPRSDPVDPLGSAPATGFTRNVLNSRFPLMLSHVVAT